MGLVFRVQGLGFRVQGFRDESVRGVEGFRLGSGVPYLNTFLLDLFLKGTNMK